jgi:hypothetical protein
LHLVAAGTGVVMFAEFGRPVFKGRKFCSSWCRESVSTPAPLLALRAGASGIRRSIRQNRSA